MRRFELQSRESSQKLQREFAICIFQYIIRIRVKLYFCWQKTERGREWRRNKLEWNRVNLRCKGGQLKLPNGPNQNLFFELILAYFEFLELNLITGLILELLINLVTRL